MRLVVISESKCFKLNSRDGVTSGENGKKRDCCLASEHFHEISSPLSLVPVCLFVSLIRGSSNVIGKLFSDSRLDQDRLTACLVLAFVSFSVPD